MDPWPVFCLFMATAIFAPDDTAFTGLPVGALSWLLLPGNTGFLVDVLGMHVVPGQTVLSTDLMDGMTLTTLNQETLTITATESGGFMVNDANIIQADLIAENGVIHIIDSVLIPERIELPFNLVEFGMGSGMFPTLFALLEATDLTDVLTSAIFTIFPPTEEAFAKLPPGTAGFLLRNPSLLTDVLLYHVVEGLLPSSNITDGMMVPTALAGSNITFGVDGNITLNDRATVVQGDLTALNGIVHVIDEVLIPPSFPPFPASLPAIVSELDNFSTLLTALNITGLVDVLAEEGPFTVLAPTDEAFANLPNGTLEALLAEEGLTTLIDILLFHVIPGEVIDEATMQAGPIDAETALGQDIAIDGGIVGDATVISFDTFGLNGVIHAIDTVLIPSPLPTIAEVGIASGLFDVVFGELTAAGLGTALDVEGPISKYRSCIAIRDSDNLWKLLLKSYKMILLSFVAAVFGPIDPVFENPEINTTDFFADPVGALLYHVCDGGYAYEDLYDGLVLTNFLSQPLYISVSPTGVRKVNGVEIIDPDFIGSNGFIHGISGIISSDFDPNEVIETPVNATTMPTNTTETPAPVSANMTMTPAPATPVPSNMTMTPAPVASTVPATPAPTPPAESSGSPVGELPGIAEVGIAYGEFDTLFTAIQNAGLADALEVDGPLSKYRVNAIV